MSGMDLKKAQLNFQRQNGRRDTAVGNGNRFIAESGPKNEIS